MIMMHLELADSQHHHDSTPILMLGHRLNFGTYI